MKPRPAAIPSGFKLGVYMRHLGERLREGVELRAPEAHAYLRGRACPYAEPQVARTLELLREKGIAAPGASGEGFVRGPRWIEAQKQYGWRVNP